MKVFAYSYRKFDEAPYFEKYCKELGIELGYTEEDPILENAHLAAGYPYISILLTRVDAALVEEFARLGVKMISNRLIGVDHVDVKRDFYNPVIPAHDCRLFRCRLVRC